MTGIIRIGVTERGSFKNYSEAVHIPFFTKAMHDLKLPTHTQNLPRICRINLKQAHCRNKGWVITLRAIFLLCTCYEMNGFGMTLLA